MLRNKPVVLPLSSWVVTEGYAGLQAQALGLAEAAGLTPELHNFRPRGVWRHVPARFWPNPLGAVGWDVAPSQLPELVIGCGGKAAAVVAALRRTVRGVIVQHPRMDISRFDLIVAARHDGLRGPNVVVTRTALHRVTKARLAEAGHAWAPRFADLPRPMVAVLVGGGNGRYRLGVAEGERLAAQLAGMMRADRAGVVLTPSRRTDAAVTHRLRERLAPLGAMIWDGTGDNPYFGMLALADAIVVTSDSVSMISEAVATQAPVLVAALPGRSRRQQLFLQGLLDDGRVRLYQGRLDRWPVAPLDDTPEAAAELRRRFGF